MRLDPGEVAPREEGPFDTRQDPLRAFGDPVVRRRDGAVAYHLASVVDDAAARDAIVRWSAPALVLVGYSPCGSI